MQVFPGTEIGRFTDGQERSRRHAAAGIGLSLLVHVLLLALVLHRSSSVPKGSEHPREGTLVLLTAPVKPASSKPAEKHKDPPRRHRKAAKPKTPPREEDTVVAQLPSPETASPAPEPAATDMMSMINAARERRRAAAAASGAKEETPQPSLNEIAAENIRSDLARRSGRPTGTNGIFEILHKGPRMAEFSFLGWREDAHHSWRQVIEVDAGPNGDVELAIVRRMIQLIRTHYQGNFNWDSRRLGRVVVLSARPEDNAELEAFLMREFFSLP